MQNTEFQTGAIKPLECLNEAWALIKDDYWLFFAIVLVGALIGGMTFYVLIGAMVCGIFLCFFTKIDTGRVSFDDLWKGLSFFMPSLLAVIVIVVPVVIWIVVLFATIYGPLITAAVMGPKVGPNELLAVFGGALLVDIIVAIFMVCFHTLLMFTFPLIVDRRLSSWVAIRTSARAVLKNIGGVAGLFALNFAITLVGELAFCIGIYFAIPVVFAVNAVAFRKVFPRLPASSFSNV
ncbi:MAG: hypothetical protein ACRD43_00695 [Pyrinomonadaceae bacterium]